MAYRRKSRRTYGRRRSTRRVRSSRIRRVSPGRIGYRL